MNDHSSTAPMNNTQYIVLWSIATIPCLLSLFGSSSIIHIARRKLRGDNVYHRLLFIVSCMDVVAISWSYFSPLLMDQSTGYMFAMGNQATCASVGFIFMFSVLTKAFYSCYIALYFMLSVRYKWSDRRVMRYEIYAHIFAFATPMSYGIVGIINKAYNANEYRFCALAKYPIGCQDDECIRGDLAPILTSISTVTAIVISAIAIICTGLLFCYVRSQTNQSSRHDFVATITAAYGGYNNNRKDNDRSRLVRTQSILYVGTNLNNFVWMILFNQLVLHSLDSQDMHDRDTLVFASGILLFFFMPMSGFFDFCIYCYPRYKRIKVHFPNKSRLWCLRLLYSVDQGESEISARRSLQRQQLSRSNRSLVSSSKQQHQQSEQDVIPKKESSSIYIDDKMMEAAETQSFQCSDEMTIAQCSDEMTTIVDLDDVVTTDANSDKDRRYNDTIGIGCCSIPIQDDPIILVGDVENPKFDMDLELDEVTC